MCARNTVFGGIAPSVFGGNNAADAEFSLNLFGVPQTDALKGESAPSIIFRLALHRLPIVLGSAMVFYKSVIKYSEIVN